MIGIERLRKCNRNIVPDRYKSLIRKDVLCGYSNNKIVIVDKVPLKFRIPVCGISELDKFYGVVEVYKIQEKKDLKIYYGKLIEVISDDIEDLFKYADSVEIDRDGSVKILTLTGYVISSKNNLNGVSMFEFPDNILKIEILNKLKDVITTEFTSNVRENFKETRVISLYDIKSNFTVPVSEDKKALKFKIVEWQLELIDELEKELSKYIKKHSNQINTFEEIVELDITQKLFKLYENVLNMLLIEDKIDRIKRIVIKTVLENELKWPYYLELNNISYDEILTTYRTLKKIDGKSISEFTKALSNKVNVV